MPVLESVESETTRPPVGAGASRVTDSNRLVPPKIESFGSREMGLGGTRVAVAVWFESKPEPVRVDAISTEVGFPLTPKVAEEFI